VRFVPAPRAGDPLDGTPVEPFTIAFAVVAEWLSPDTHVCHVENWLRLRGDEAVV
jgi:hypothetical protein